MPETCSSSVANITKKKRTPKPAHGAAWPPLGMFLCPPLPDSRTEHRTRTA